MSDLSSEEIKASAKLIAAKDAYRNDPSPDNERRRDQAVAAISAIRNKDRADRVGTMIVNEQEN